MHHETSLITTMIAGIVAVFAFAAIATRLRAPPLNGHLAAGMVIGPFTPGYVAGLELAPKLAELGVIFLMFGVGLHFSLDDLRAVCGIAAPGLRADRGGDGSRDAARSGARLEPFGFAALRPLPFGRLDCGAAKGA